MDTATRAYACRSAVALILLTAAPSAAAPTKSTFDGSWSVLVVTEAGSCDRAYRYDVQVTGGVLRYRGDAGIQLAGRVNPGGRVQVTIGRGSQLANATGRLLQSSGSGTWKGRSSKAQCSGHWQAERRG